MAAPSLTPQREMFHNEEHVFLPGSSGEPTALVAEAFLTPGIEITTSFVPGINVFPTNAMAPRARCTTFFMQAAATLGQRAGTVRHLPLSYASIAKLFEDQAPFDTCVVQLTPPDNMGFCSLGPAAEFTPIVLRRARRVVAVINSNVPRLPHAPVWRHGDCDLVVESDTPITNYDCGKPDPVSEIIAGYVASLVRDGATLQLGLGKVPAAIYANLGNHRGLRFHTGMLSDGIMDLAAKGALDSDFEHKTTVILGTAALYRWAAGRADIHVVGSDHIHALPILSGLDGLVAVNSALEVDLFGQCNLEFASGRAVSGAGGAPDFAHAARRSRNGLSIIALPATYGAGKASRITAVLGQHAIVSLPRTDVDVVITEEGIADLRGKSVFERGEALIEISGAAFRPLLHEAWASIRNRL